MYELPLCQPQLISVRGSTPTLSGNESWHLVTMAPCYYGIPLMLQQYLNIHVVLELGKFVA